MKNDAVWPELVPVFMRALGSLRMRGFSIDGGQMLDIVHDFFLERWPAVQKSYRTGEGELSPYARRAFINFARTRLIREARWREALTSPPLEESATSEEGPEEGLQLDLVHVRRALDELPEKDRSLLSNYFSDPPRSERHWARVLGMSRYALRSRLVEGLARLVVALGESAVLDLRERQILESLLGQDMSIERTAAELNLTTQQVKSIKERALAKLGSRLRSVDHGQ